MTTARATKPPMVLVIEAGRYAGCILNRGVAGHEAFDAADQSLGLFETPAAARDAVLKARSA
jgi:hypothetical protein